MLKRAVLSAILALSLSGALFAQTDPFFPLNPSTVGRGGSFTADAEGYNAFFYNPAGFAKKGELTLLSLNGWVVMDSGLLGALVSLATGEEVDFNSLTKGLDSRSGLPPELAGFQAVIDSLTVFTDYFGAAAADDPSGFQAAIEAAIDSDEVKAILYPGADISNITTAEQLLSVLNLPAILVDPSLIAAVLDEMVIQVDTLTTYTGATPPPGSSAAVATSVDAALQDSAASLPKGNMDIGVMVGAGWVGKGLGIGVFVNANGVVRTPKEVDGREGTILDAKARVFNTMTLAAGAGFSLGENLDIGVALRPTMLSYGDISPIGAVALMSDGGMGDPIAMLDSLLPAGYYKAFYMGVDAGATLRLPLGLTAGATIKDMLPGPMAYYRFPTTAEMIQAFPFQLDTGSNQVSEADIEKFMLYQIAPFKINAGLTWHPDLGAFAAIIDPRVGIDLFDVLGFVRYLGNDPNPSLLVQDFNIMNHVGLGADVRIMSILKARAGLYQGALTGGVAIDIPLLEVSLTGIARNLEFVEGQLPTFTEAGMAFEVALRL